MELQALALGPLLIAFAAVGGMIIPTVFGARWLPSFEIYPYVALGTLTNCIFSLHASSLYVIRRNWDVALFHIVHMALFAGAAYCLISTVGLKGYGLAEIVALPSYAVLNANVRRAIGAISYRHVLPWYGLFVLSLSLYSAGLWICAIPLLALAWPPTRQRLRGYLAFLKA
jgi:PST family polysaccharide transporter